MFKRAITFLALFALTLFVVGGVALISAPDAHAAALATCSGTGCDGLDPSTTGCDVNATTPASTGLRQGVDLSYIQMRWGPGCKTNWTRALVINSYLYTYQLNISREAGNGLTARTIANPGLACNNVCWSDQLYTNTNRGQSCIYGPAMDTSPICTPWT